MKKLLLVPVLAIVLAACTPLTPQTSAPAEDEAMMEDKTDGEAMMEKEGVQAYDVEMFAFGYSMPEIKVKAGDTVRLNLTTRASDKMIHDFVIDELDVASTQLAAGETETIEFTVPASAAGTSYEFYCSVGAHRANGMVGTLMVE